MCEFVENSDIAFGLKKVGSDKLANRQNVSRACLSCRRSHLACDHQRPCSRCAARGIECVEDTTIKKRGPKSGAKRASEKCANKATLLSENMSEPIAAFAISPISQERVWVSMDPFHPQPQKSDDESPSIASGIELSPVHCSLISSDDQVDLKSSPDFSQLHDVPPKRPCSSNAPRVASSLSSSSSKNPSRKRVPAKTLRASISLPIPDALTSAESSRSDLFCMSEQDCVSTSAFSSSSEGEDDFPVAPLRADIREYDVSKKNECWISRLISASQLVGSEKKAAVVMQLPPSTDLMNDFDGDDVVVSPISRYSSFGRKRVQAPIVSSDVVDSVVSFPLRTADVSANSEELCTSDSSLVSGLSQCSDILSPSSLFSPISIYDSMTDPKVQYHDSSKIDDSQQVLANRTLHVFRTFLQLRKESSVTPASSSLRVSDTRSPSLSFA